MSEEKKIKYLAFDCETGGVTPDTSILTAFFAVVEITYNGEYKWEILDSLDVKLIPDDKKFVVTPYAMKVNGLNLASYVEDEEALKYSEFENIFSEWITPHTNPGEDSRIRSLGHNVKMDIDFVTKHLIPHSKWNKLVHYRAMDTSPIARFLQDGGWIDSDLSCSLGSLVEHYEIDIPEGGLHSAKADTIVTVTLYTNLLNELENIASNPLA